MVTTLSYVFQITKRPDSRLDGCKPYEGSWQWIKKGVSGSGRLRLLSI